MSNTTRARAKCAAAFVGAAILGASMTVHATSQCRDWVESLGLELVSVAVDGVEQPVEAEPDRCRKLELQSTRGGCLGLVITPSNGGITARLYDPQTKEAREISLVER